ncbi:4-hydroxy-tetrahydrodipicolinate synthase [Paraburkholderia sp. Tr-20389]|uniref:4-hydroxy-tetrahydrodipicolinate synthase n=1 Tax=Paraburkholderia sp. Tr-20389 TaxID=2703903 RepID=UPI00197E78E4|nr:4-hydroxy-tetrahydrodipicolinate synthase [Paraburkholderia sp. Tr-20389]MBN3755994.1 4-hydroxy-tetrahydrodipicolinate synthase [Paraburkholderia sp. Tr-20389]
MNDLSHPIRGSIAALVTPMHDDGSLDLPALRALVDWHVASGTVALVAVGTTGESPTVSVDEHLRVIEACVERTAGRIPVIAGSGANSTAEAIELTVRAKALGASASLQVVPYYNKPTQEGLYRHFASIAEAVDLPVILYNVPGRTGADLGNETVLRLARVPGVAGIKDATGDLERGMRLLHAAPPGFAVYSGDDVTAPLLMLMGGSGNISVTANVMPRAMAALCDAALAGDAATVRVIQLELIGLHHALFVEANPIPVKWLLARMGKIRGGIRLPLTQHDERFHSTLADALDRAETACEAILVREGRLKERRPGQ